jgi:hypothetical protein
MATDDQTKKMGQIIARTWSDEAFKQRLLADPAATLKAEGVAIPAGVELRTVENTDKVFYFVLPPKPATGELSDEDLEKVAGGLCVHYCPKFLF